MINRLTSLQLENFRLFQGKYDFPLDANVVLIHGNNGTAKSSLLYGIEFALTGLVSDLANFSEDYPRCLTTANSNPPTVATLGFQMDGIAEVSKSSLVGDRIEFSRASAGDIDSSFLERCFLSQVRLSRLLEAYQTVSKGSSETPIAMFVKQLLNLDLLDNLGTALHDFDDRRRMKRAYPEISRLEDCELRNTEDQNDLKERIQTAEQLQRSRISEARDILTKLGESIRSDEWTLERIRNLQVKVSDPKVTRQLESEVGELQESQLSLRAFKSLLDFADGNAAELVRNLEMLLKTQIEEIRTLESDVNPILKRISEDLQVLDLRKNLPDLSTPSNRLAATMRDVIIDARSDTEIRIRSFMALESDLKNVIEMIQRVSASSDRVRLSLTSSSSALQSNIEFLARAAHELKGELCPVCQRDFSETKKSTLESYIAQRIAELGGQAQQMALLAKENEDNQVQLASLNTKKSLLERQKENGKGLEYLTKLREKLDSIELDLNAVIERATQLSQVQLQHRNVLDQLSTARAKSADLLKAIDELPSIAKIAKTNLSLKGPLSESIAQLENDVKSRIDLLREKIVLMKQAAESLQAISDGFLVREKLDGQWLSIDKRVQTAKKAREEIDAIVASGKLLLKASLNAKKELLDSVFNDRLNRVWADLFERLVPEEHFRPRLSEPSSKRDQILTAINAIADGVKPFENLGAIQSLGNLNTSALSLFLALNLLQPKGHKVLLLDDPVQSMDDVHISQLALLLRELVNQAGRQIVVAVHERPLFDFLTFELAPSKADQSLITIDLIRRMGSSGLIFESSTHVWEADKVEVQTEVIQRSA